MLNKRIAEIRKELNYSMEKFGQRIGISKAAVNQIEKGVNNPSEQTVRLICQEFGINEEWLLHGTGERKKKNTTDQTVVDFLVDVLELPDENFKKKLINALAHLNKEEWEVLEQIASHLNNEKG